MRDTNQGKVNIFAIIVVVIILVAGAVCVGIFAVTLSSAFKEMEDEMSINPKEYDAAVQATIIDYIESQSSMGQGTDTYTSDVYCPIYRYEFNGETYTVSGDISTSEKFYEIGDVTNVMISSEQPDKMYDPNFNAKSEYDSFKKEAIRMMVIPTIVGIMITIAVVVLVVIEIRKRIETMRMISTDDLASFEDTNNQEDRF